MAFYKSRATFHPASANLPNTRPGLQSATGPNSAGPSRSSVSTPSKEPHSFFRAFSSATSRGKEKEKASSTSSSTGIPSSSSVTATNVFSLVERFTFRPSSTETDLPNPPPKLPPEIQYWAGVIMRNACRKDDSRGGIRQCANMLCGRWESYPREFAKCRRCRKAKYCGKECQSTAWSEGHRFWCSAKDGDEDATDPVDQQFNPDVAVAGETGATPPGVAITTGGTVTGRAERRAERERERHARERALSAVAGADVTQATRTTLRNPHNTNPAETSGNYTTRATGTAANRPLLAPAVQPWANRPQPYTRPMDAASTVGLLPPAPRATLNPQHPGRPLSVHLDQQVPSARRTEPISRITTGSNNMPDVMRRFSGATENVVATDVGPSRGRFREDYDMSLD